MAATIELLDVDPSEGGTRTALDVALAIEEGLSVKMYDKVVKRYELTPQEAEQIVTRKTLGRRREAGILSVEESNKLARFYRVFKLAEETLGSVSMARQWMRRRNRALRGHHPVALLKTDQGARLVEQVLGRIAYGVFS